MSEADQLCSHVVCTYVFSRHAAVILLKLIVRMYVEYGNVCGSWGSVSVSVS